MSAAGGLILLDTSVLVQLLRGSPLGKTIQEEQGLDTLLEKPIVSIITHGEILALARKWNWGPKGIARVDELVSSLVVADIRPRPVVEQYAAISAFCQANGKAVGQNDMWIAATASAHGATLITTDKDFDALEPRFLKRIYYPQGA